DLEGLAQRVLDAELACNREVIDAGAARDGDDARTGQPSPQGGDRLDAVHLRHEEVGHDGIESLAVEHAQGLLAVARAQDLVTLELQRLAQVFPQVRVVLNDQYFHVRFCCNARSGGHAPGFGDSCRWITTTGQYDTTVK